MDEQNPVTRELVSLREYARRRGCSLSTVQAAVKAGRIRTFPDAAGKAKIDPFEADRDFQANTDPSKQGRKKFTQRSEGGGGFADDEQGQSSGAFMRAKTKREKYQAALKKLEFKKRIGELVEAAEVREAALEMARALRQALMSIPDRFAGRIAGETDTHVIRTLLEAELVKALGDIADAGRV